MKKGNKILIRARSKPDVERKVSDFEMKIMQSAKAYRDKPTIDKKFSAEIRDF